VKPAAATGCLISASNQNSAPKHFQLESVRRAFKWAASFLHYFFALNFCTNPLTMDAATAQKNWELENNITTVDPTLDHIYYYDAVQDKENVAQKPWKAE
jgi:hypothetical protein